MDWALIVPTIIAFTIMPILGFWIEGSFTIESARRGYMYCSVVVFGVAAAIFVFQHENNMIGWGALSLFTFAFGRWGIPGLRALFSGEHDDKIVKMFRE